MKDYNDFDPKAWHKRNSRDPEERWGAAIVLVLIVLFIVSAACLHGQVPKSCPKGQYRSVDGRCLRDRTGETRPAGDGCNTITCMDKACRLLSETSAYCVHSDDPVTDTMTFDGTAPNVATVSPWFASAVWIDKNMTPVATCGEDKDQKLIDCKIADGHTLTELLQLITDAQMEQYNESQRVLGICKNGLEIARQGLKQIQKTLKGK